MTELTEPLPTETLLCGLESMAMVKRLVNYGGEIWKDSETGREYRKFLHGDGTHEFIPADALDESDLALEEA